MRDGDQTDWPIRSSLGGHVALEDHRAAHVTCRTSRLCLEEIGGKGDMPVRAKETRDD